MSKYQRNPGRTRRRLARLLEKHGVLVEPEDLWTQEGFYRNVHHDLARWGTNHARFVNSTAPDGTKWMHEFHISSWSTMGDCLKWGISIGKDNHFSWSVEHARQPGEK